MSSPAPPEDERARRIGLNESVFREVNERLQELANRFELREEPLDLVCECGSIDCDERIRVSAADYERIRSEPTLFVVVPGHEVPDVEDIVRQGSGYDVVEKRAGVPESIARETDPRDSS
jgi:hypothetical protein